MSDLVRRLRQHDGHLGYLVEEAADEIDRLTAQVEQYGAKISKDTIEIDRRGTLIDELTVQVERQRTIIDWVESWVGHSAGYYSVHALDGLFGMTRDKIAALHSFTSDGTT